MASKVYDLDGLFLGELSDVDENLRGDLMVQVDYNGHLEWFKKNDVLFEAEKEIIEND